MHSAGITSGWYFMSGNIPVRSVVLGRTTWLTPIFARIKQRCQAGSFS
jgi:hypothetical protein